MSKQVQDKITGFGALGIGLLMLRWVIPRWVVTTDTFNLTSPDTFPRFASWMLVILGAVLLIKTYVEGYALQKGTAFARREQTDVQAKPAAPQKKFWETPAFCVAATFFDALLFGFLLEKAGYVIASLVCCVLLLAAYRVRKWYYYFTVIAFTLVLFYVFSVLLRVTMP